MCYQAASHASTKHSFLVLPQPEGATVTVPTFTFDCTVRHCFVFRLRRILHTYEGREEQEGCCPTAQFEDVKLGKLDTDFKADAYTVLALATARHPCNTSTV